MRHIPTNVVIFLGGLGALVWFGALCGVLSLRQSDLRRLAPILVTVVSGTLALTFSAVVFDRYGLSLMPGLTILAALGWERWLTMSHANLRLVGTAAFAICLGTTTTNLIATERRNAELDVDVLVKRWILANVPRGKNVALHNEVNAFLPRISDQLLECANAVRTPEAYEEKWLVEGSAAPVRSDVEAMQSVILNDELFHAYWCRRELQAQLDPGFRVVTYHAEPRFGAVLEKNVLNEFRSGKTSSTGRIDVLVENRAVDVGVEPAQIFETRRGRRLIYVR